MTGWNQGQLDELEYAMKEYAVTPETRIQGFQVASKEKCAYM